MKISGPPWTARLRHYLHRGPGKLAFLQAAADRHRPLVELSLVPPRQRSFLLTEPDDIGYVLQTHHAHYRKSNVLTGPRGRQRSGTGLLTGVGQPAITQKRLLQPVLAQAVGLAAAATLIAGYFPARWAARQSVVEGLSEA